ncbi:MAG: transglutaminase-like domain-containing protein [Acidobacteriota bacterium]|nr:transglutaminase-like domain-containing protein [Acidobacteriota bacterium]
MNEFSDALIDLLAGRNENIELDRAALQLASIEFPGLDPDPFLRMLDDYSVGIADRVPDLSNGPKFVAAANRYLFREIGLSGNADDYYHPHNSCLNQVLSEHKGIPITLSLIYIEVARRLAKPVRGIGLPGHFLVRYDDGEYSTFIDPFHGGRLLEDHDCYALAQATVADPRMLAPVSKRQIILRMIHNLRGIYVSQGAYAKELQILDLLVRADPDAAEEYKHRGLAHLRSRQMRAAKADLRRYLQLAPDAPDRGEIERQVRAIARWLATMN